MILYGCIANNSYTDEQRHLKFPEMWSPEIDVVRKYPYINLPQFKWGDIDKSSFKVFEMELEPNYEKEVFDLRRSDWKLKYLMFIMWYGLNWKSKKGLAKDKSPLDYVLYLGNFHILSTQGYKWVAVNHYCENIGPIEIWFYVDIYENPKNEYSIRRIKNEEFFDGQC